MSARRLPCLCRQQLSPKAPAVSDRPANRPPDFSNPLSSCLYADAAQRNLHARSHRRTDGNPFHIDAFGALRLRLGDAIDKTAHVLDEGLFVEARLADTALHDACFLDAIFD